MIETYGRNFRVVLREEKTNEKCFIFNGDIMAIREPLKEGKDIYFKAFNNEYDKKMNHKLDSKKDIMKVFNEVGKLVWDREKEESKTDWSKVELGTDVEFSVGNDTWRKAKFVLFEPKSGIILMTDGKEMICNHRENSVRLVGKSKKSDKKDMQRFVTPFGVVRVSETGMDDFFNDVINELRNVKR